MDTLSLIVSILLVVFLITDIAAAYLLTKTSAKVHYSLIALNERAFVATVQAISASGLALLGMNRIFNWHIGEPLVLIILSASLLLQATPSIVWLFLYFRNKFNASGHIED